MVYGTSGQGFLLMNPQSSAQPPASFVAGGAELTVLLTFLLPGQVAGVGRQLLNLAAPPGFSLQLSVTPPSLVTAFLYLGLPVQSSGGSSTVNSMVRLSAPLAVQARRLFAGWVSVAVVLSGTGTASLYVRDTQGSYSHAAGFVNATDVFSAGGPVTSTFTPLNGTAAASVLSSALNQSITNFNVLGWNYGTGNMTAAVADVQIYPVALTAAQVAGLWTGTSTLGCTVQGAGWAPTPPAPGVINLPPTPPAPPLPPPSPPAPPPPFFQTALLAAGGCVSGPNSAFSVCFSASQLAGSFVLGGVYMGDLLYTFGTNYSYTGGAAGATCPDGRAGTLGVACGSAPSLLLNGNWDGTCNTEIYTLYVPTACAPPPPLPPPLPPPQAPPAPPAGIVLETGFTVSSTATLGGYSRSSFDAGAQSSFVTAMASVLSVSTSALTVTGVSDAPARRRHLAQSGGVAVDFTVKVASADSANAMASSITALPAAAFVVALQQSGLTAVTGVVVKAPVIAGPPPPVVNVSTITAAAIENVAAALSSMDAGTAAQQQTAILSSLSGGSVSANMSSAAAESAASLVLAVVGATATLSPLAQDAALGALSLVASAPLNISGGAAQSITSALSAVATSASASNPAALAQVQNVLNNLASSTASSLVAALSASGGVAPPAATTSSPTIQTLVQIDPPGSSRLTTQSLTAPGSPSSFEPMPAGLLDPNAAVVTQFFSLAFDPNALTGNGSALNTTGVTRLAFTNPDGSPMPVENASAPIRFSLPRVDTSGDAQVRGALAYQRLRLRLTRAAPGGVLVLGYRSLDLLDARLHRCATTRRATSRTQI